MNQKYNLKAIIEEYITYYNSFNIDKMVELFSDDCIFQNLSNTSEPIECIGKDNLYKMATESAKIFLEREQSVTNWIVGDNKAAIQINYCATIAIDLPNGLKKGSHLKLKGISIFEFENGKIKHLIDFS